MPQPVKIAILVVYLLIGLAAHATATAQDLVEYRNGIWWDGRSEVTGSRFVRGDRFVVADGYEAAGVVDLQGAVVTAPFGEGHNHNVVRPIFDFANQEYISDGVFYAKIPGIHPPEVLSIRDLLDRADTIDATFSLGNITSPGGHPVPIYTGFLSKLLYSGGTYEDFSGVAFHEVETDDEIAAALEAMDSFGTDFVKAYLTYSEDYDQGLREGLDPDLLPFLVRNTHELGMTLSLHVDSAEDFRRGVAAGVDEITHIPGYIWGRDRSAADHLLTEDDTRRAAETGVAVVTTTHYANVISKRFGIPENVVNEFKSAQRSNLRLLIESGVEVRIGSDVYDRADDGQAANPTRKEVENLVELGVYDTESVLSLWIETARTIFPQRRIGCFEPGCEASFLVFDADPRENLTNLDHLIFAIKQGITVFRQESP